MATTTNYNWSTPDDTALVKDGAAAIRSLGTAIDTTTKNLNPSTTTGDIEYRSSTPNVNTRLSIGTAGQVLKVNSGATAPEWASASSGELKEVVFTSSNATWTIPTGVTGIWALCVGSGGGGGASSNATSTNSGGGGGAGQAIEKFITIVGDTTLNITVPAGGAGGTAGGKGSSGSVATIVGNTSATTYLSAAGGGGGGGGGAANLPGINGASGGGLGRSGSNTSGGGGGMGSAATSNQFGILNSLPTIVGGDAIATTVGVTGYDGGSVSALYGGQGINIFGRSLCGGGAGSATSAGISQNFGAGAATAIPSAGSSGAANTGAGGNGGKTNATTALAGGAGGSGLVVLRYVGA
jgi:hypothetical protein